MPELTESLVSINRQLRDLYGLDTISSKPIWRIVWSEEQLEKKLVNYSPAGVAYLTPQIVEAPKYRQWIHNKFVLERLTLVPSAHEELTVEKISYEPIWVFEDNHGNALPPRLDASKLIIDTLYAALGKVDLSKYADPGESVEVKEERLDKLQAELFGNETNVGDALAHGEAIVVPRNYKVN